MDNKICFLHTADLHLGAATMQNAALSATRRNESLLTLENLFTICKDRNIPLFLIAGDLLENNSVESKFFEAFLRCVKENPQLTVVFAAGNHDPLTADSPFLNTKLPENLIVLSTEDECIELENLPIRIYGKSFSSVYMKGKNNFSIPAKNDEKINIMVLHGELTADLNSPYNAVTNKFLESAGMDYIALGHIHAASSLKKIGSTYFAYSGTPEPHGFDEAGEKGVIIGTISKTDFRYEFLPTHKRRYETEEIDISLANDTIEAVEIIINTLKNKYLNFENNFYKIILIGALGADVFIDTEEILTRLSEKLYFVKIRDNTTLKIDLDVLKQENSLKGKFVKLMLQKIEAAEKDQKDSLERALYIGLKAFSSGVKYNEN